MYNTIGGGWSVDPLSSSGDNFCVGLSGSKKINQPCGKPVVISVFARSLARLLCDCEAIKNTPLSFSQLLVVIRILSKKKSDDAVLLDLIKGAVRGILTARDTLGSPCRTRYNISRHESVEQRKKELKERKK